MALTKRQLVEDLAKLGVKKGDSLMVHSALSALGTVRGGADTVIDALLEAVGPEGNVAMPLMTGNGVFKIEESPSNVGIVTEVFRQRKETVRSLHPSHSVGVQGKDAQWLVKDHVKQPTAYGKGTPYHKLVELGGKVLLLGVDQDRNTTLHTIESLAGVPYLKTITRQYVDVDGKEKTCTIHDMAGPHRDFIGLDSKFRKAGVMEIGKVGTAVCRLIDGKGMVETGMKAFADDPASVLCDNANCRDCVTQRALIKKHKLSQEDFTLSAVSDEAGDSLDDLLKALEDEGLSTVELRAVDDREVVDFAEGALAVLRKTLEERGFSVSAISTKSVDPDPEQMLSVAKALGAKALVLPYDRFDPACVKQAKAAGVEILLENRTELPEQCEEVLAAAKSPVVGAAFNPLGFAIAGKRPFLKAYYKGKLKRFVRQLYVTDGTGEGEATLPGQGNGEVKELLSILRCRSFDGFVTIRAETGKPEAFKESAKAFWKLLDSM